MSIMESFLGPKKLTKEQEAIQATRVEDGDKARAMADASHHDRSFAVDRRRRAQEYKNDAQSYKEGSYESEDLNAAALKRLTWAADADKRADEVENAAADAYDESKKRENGEKS